MPTADPADAVLLDTHVVLWWQADGNRLSRPAAAAIERARRLLVSPISFWELAMLVEKARVGLDRPTAQWVSDFLDADRVEIAELTTAVAVAAGELVGFHGDPADRLLVASARSHGVPMLTKDDRIRAYARSSRRISAIW